MKRTSTPIENLELSQDEVILPKSPRFLIIDDDNIMYNDNFFVKEKSYDNIFNIRKDFDIIIEDDNKTYLYFENYLYRMK